MNRLSSLLTTICIAAMALAACGGGGGQSASPGTDRGPALKVPVRDSSPKPLAASRTAVGTAVLTIKLPNTLTALNAQSANRRPAYVNPSCGGSCKNVLDIFVDGSLIENLDGIVGSSHTIDVVSTAAGSIQTVSVPLFSTSTNDIVAVEKDSTGEDMLAVGNAYIGSFSAGTTVSTTLTMLMNVSFIGIVNVQSQNDPQLVSGTYDGLYASCGSSGLASQFGLYTADDLGTFVPVAGYGGTSTPTIVASPVPGSQTVVAQTTIPGVYEVVWDSPCNSVSVTATAANPAYAIVQDEAFGDPLDSYGDSTYGYYDCYYDEGSCPGGPNQALWNFYNIYYENYYPQYLVNSPTVTGTVIISASPPP